MGTCNGLKTSDYEEGNDMDSTGQKKTRSSQTYLDELNNKNNNQERSPGPKLENRGYWMKQKSKPSVQKGAMNIIIIFYINTPKCLKLGGSMMHS